MLKRRGKHVRKARRGAWVGPLFAIEALLVTFSAKKEFDAAVASQQGGTP
jgi:hypothetical protein